ncbi:FAD-dependent oxidoreductase [Povalibacter sp.]|uniref:FAD-dependent oxidoreductase n=1 Tax=Povalibacter sp. TaxID=1962978 RepID=UPI002F3F8A82
MTRLGGSSIQACGAEIAFDMDGVPVTAIEGETVAAALLAAGKVQFRRDRAGVARGPLCGMGVCFDCEVDIDGVRQRACLTKARAGMKIRSSHYRVGGIKPGGGVVRHEEIVCEVLIVGAGPAGMTAAVALADAGIAVVIVEERAEPGGQYFKQLAPSQRFQKDADNQYAEGRRLIGRLAETTARLITGATVWGASRLSQRGRLRFEIGAAQRTFAVETSHVILATGAFESVPAFTGWTLPGVLTTGAAQGFVRSYRVAPGRRVLIAGNGPLNLQLAAELLDGGVEVVGVAEAARRPSFRSARSLLGAFLASPGLMVRGAGYLATLRKHRVPLWFGYHVVAAIGGDRVKAATISSPGGDEMTFDVDTVCVGYSLQPANELARLLGCRHVANDTGVLVPVRDENGQSSEAGVFVVGDSGRIGGAHVAIAEGAIAAAAIANELSKPLAPPGRYRRQLQRHRRFQRHLWTFYQSTHDKGPAADVIVCRCERVTAGELTCLLTSGIRDGDSLKRISRAGMGMCQGRYCSRRIAALIAEHTLPNAGPTSIATARMPVKPTLIAGIAAEKPEWHGYRTTHLPATAASAGDDGGFQDAQVLVIGAGIIGVSTALYLARAGVDVLLIDQGAANGQASGANAGSLHLQLLSWDLAEEPAARAIAAETVRLQQLGIAAWQELQHEVDGDFEMRLSGGIVVAETDAQMEFLAQKAALERKFGVAVEMLSGSDLQRMIPAVADTMIGGTYCGGEGKINPMLATPMVLRKALQAGARFEANVAVCGIEPVRNGYRVATTRGTIRCGKIVNAAGGWCAGIAALVGASLPVQAAAQQMIVTEPTDLKIDYLLALSQRHLTMKQAPNGNLLIGGGWPAAFDAQLGKAVTLRDSIEGNLWVAQRVVPAIGQLRMLRSWATVGVMIDGAPILGELPGRPGFFNAVGANGYTMGPILGRITAELVTTGAPSTDVRPFAVERFGAR